MHEKSGMSYDVSLKKWKIERKLGRWRRRRMLGSPRPADHLDSTHTCLNNPENRQKTSRTYSPEPRVDERSTEEGRKGGEAVALHRLAGGSWARGAARWPKRAPESGLQKWRGQMECVLTASGT